MALLLHSIFPAKNIESKVKVSSARVDSARSFVEAQELMSATALKTREMVVDDTSGEVQREVRPATPFPATGESSLKGGGRSRGSYDWTERAPFQSRK